MPAATAAGWPVPAPVAAHFPLPQEQAACFRPAQAAWFVSGLAAAEHESAAWAAEPLGPLVRSEPQLAVSRVPAGLSQAFCPRKLLFSPERSRDERSPAPARSAAE